jgi:hypothetical protein
MSKLIYSFRQKNNKPHKITYTRREWLFKCGLLLLAVYALDFCGIKVSSVDFLVINGQLNPVAAYGFSYYFYLAAQGLVLGLGFWRLLEIYWFGKQLVTDALYTVTTDNTVMQSNGGD